MLAYFAMYRHLMTRPVFGKPLVNDDFFQINAKKFFSESGVVLTKLL